MPSRHEDLNKPRPLQKNPKHPGRLALASNPSIMETRMGEGGVHWHCWPIELTVSPKFSKIPFLKWRTTEETSKVSLWPPRSNTRMQRFPCAHEHTHTHRYTDAVYSPQKKKKNRSELVWWKSLVLNMTDTCPHT